jgi:hypothetical protein
MKMPPRPPPRPPPFSSPLPASAPLVPPPLLAPSPAGKSHLRSGPSSNHALHPSRRPCFGRGPAVSHAPSSVKVFLPLVAGSTTPDVCRGRSGLDAVVPPVVRATLPQARRVPPLVTPTSLPLDPGRLPLDPAGASSASGEGASTHRHHTCLADAGANASVGLLCLPGG